ncbi:hypothetical protein CRX72_07305 [Pantoea sp. BRM17]|nr:hypothetical protein CRX72_07305 [Pantoea sp. BRM17]
MENSEVQAVLMQALSLDEVHVMSNDGSHFQVIAVGEMFGELSRVKGLALLVHLREMVRAQGSTPLFTGVTDKLHSLITLYNLQQIIVSAEKSV